jgi:hypothetical protein
MKAKRKYKKRKKKGEEMHGVALTHNAAEKHHLHVRLKESGLETFKDFAFGVVGGGLIGRLLGKSSLLIGGLIKPYQVRATNLTARYRLAEKERC